MLDSQDRRDKMSGNLLLISFLHDPEQSTLQKDSQVIAAILPRMVISWIMDITGRKLNHGSRDA